MAGGLWRIHHPCGTREKVTAYVLNQEAHHRGTTFQEEYVRLLKKGLVEYDDLYLW